MTNHIYTKHPSNKVCKIYQFELKGSPVTYVGIFTLQLFLLMVFKILKPPHQSNRKKNQSAVDVEIILETETSSWNTIL